MYTCKWEHLKLKACRVLSGAFHEHWHGIYGTLCFIEQMRTGQPVKSWRKNAVEFRQMAWSIIENWDIRCAERLLECFPSILPKKHHNSTPIAEMDEKGDWIILFP